MNDIHEKYAKLLVQHSLRLKKDDRFFVMSSYLAEDLLKEVYREALAVGAHPEFQVSLNNTEKIFYDCAADEQLRYVSPVSTYVVENYDALLTVLAPFNLKELENVEPKKKQTVAIARTELRKTILKRTAQKDLNWTICAFPTDAAAQECGMSRTEYERFIYAACLLYEDDPVAKWHELEKEQQRAVDHLNGKDEIKFVGKDIDIKFSAKGRKWINCQGKYNMPDGEIFTTPVEDSVTGKVRFSYPGFYLGQEIEDITLEVKDGQVVRWNAQKGKQLLDKILEIPGARRFGEAAVGTNSGIKRFTKNMLFDEKMGGTIHMAIGAAPAEAGGKNESGIHWDMLADMSEGGQIYADGELVYSGGKFII
ncbi:MAG: aminopeptidase [Planctomycetota bacterium]|jgi:aminopeptidase